MIPDSELTYETQFNAEFWKYNSEFHRDFGPAIIVPGIQYWFSMANCPASTVDRH
jgi:hypothetical protein